MKHFICQHSGSILWPKGSHYTYITSIQNTLRGQAHAALSHQHMNMYYFLFYDPGTHKYIADKNCCIKQTWPYHLLQMQPFPVNISRKK